MYRFHVNFKLRERDENKCGPTSEYIFFARSEYPTLSTGLQNTMDARVSNHLSNQVLTR